MPHLYVWHKMRPIVTNVGWSVCLLVTRVSHAESAELIEMLFRIWNHGGPHNHLLDRGPDPPQGRGERGILGKHVQWSCMLMVSILSVIHKRQHMEMWPLAVINVAVC